MSEDKLEKVEVQEAPGIPKLAALALPEFSNHSVCQECPGYCCKRFWLQHTKTEIKKSLAAGRMLDRAAGEFVIKFFRRLPNKDKPKSYNLYYVAYTCKKFDSKLGRCKAYKNRPTVCKWFICAAARSGTPPASSGEYEDTLRWGETVLARRKRQK